MAEKGSLVVISGFSGAGKGTVVKELEKLGGNYWTSVSMTTRRPRPGEEEGLSYYFVTREEFEKTIEENGFLEYAAFVDNYYGTPRKYVEEKLAEGRDVILEIESNGGSQVKTFFPEAILIFITAPSAGELAQRLRGRGTEAASVVEGRLRKAREESFIIDQYDYLLVNENGKARECAEQIHEIIRKDRYAPRRQQAFIRKLQDGFAELIERHLQENGP
ncbi:guanylate kinase [Lachnoclostridium sp. Marseille-P6806]|uniref:guanylate kinase n=1 Tax=Lachnoclostridium sp. Marseille-P6806 TaxID=2364793 RepID=UPI001030C86F|nr:guanylate kinase [Lachnoclostridium sp. Marseille-P6806]